MDLPIGRGHALSHSNRLVDGVLGGWQLSNIFLIQSGPFRTPIFLGGDPSGTGSGTVTTQLHDRIKSGKLAHPTADEWFDTTAFVCPGVTGWTAGQPCTIGVDPASDPPPIGRFGNSGVSVVTGPGTVNLSTGLAKAFAVRERTRLKLEASFTNILM